MKHKHYEMIVAKAKNMELVVFEKSKLNGWVLLERHLIPDSDACDYFLCLPQHKEACLHWLNGGDVQVQDFPTNDFNDYLDEKYEWSLESWWMSEQCNVRIKPKKEKRWIGYCANTNQTFPHPQNSKELAGDYAAINYRYNMSDWQFIEIEVEV